jgi:hypothetical protein
MTSSALTYLCLQQQLEDEYFIDPCLLSYSGSTLLKNLSYIRRIWGY